MRRPLPRRAMLVLAAAAACVAGPATLAARPAPAIAATPVAAVTPSPSPVTPTITVPAAGIDWKAGKITVSATYPAGTSSVVFTAAGTQIAAITTDPSADGTCSSGVAVRLSVPTQFTAEGFDDHQAQIWGPVNVTLSPASFVPTKPRLLLAWSGLVEPATTAKATFKRPATRATVWAGPDSLSVRPTFTFGASGGLSMTNLRIPYGEEKVAITVRNGFGAAVPSYKVLVYSLGRTSRLPKVKRFVLVDKYSMALYDIVSKHVRHMWWIAIGAPATPTPNGYFKIGRAQPASGPWGVERRPLYRFKGSHLYASGYYIHGTDEAWSIGTMASHGCVRMWNWEIRAFTRWVPNGTLVLIR